MSAPKPIRVVCWKWGRKFSAWHVNVLGRMLARQLRLPFTLTCITDDPAGIDEDIAAVPMPRRFEEAPRCRRRMQQFSRAFIHEALGLTKRASPARVLAIDLDVVLVDDITPIVDRPEPIVAWRVGHASVLSGSFVLFDAGALEGAFVAYAEDPVGFPMRVQPRGVPSDQAMLNFWLQESRTPVAEWTEADGFVTYYGAGYGRFEHLGVGPNRRELPAGARIVVLGSEDLLALEKPNRFQWVKEHYR